MELLILQELYLFSLFDRFGFLLSYLSAKTLSHDFLMRAVTKSTRDYEALVMEKVLPWYEWEGSEIGETFVLLYVYLDFDISPLSIPSPLYQSNTLSLTNGLYSLAAIL